MASSWSDLRRRVARIGAALDVVVRSDPEVCGLSGSGYHLTLHHSGYGDCTVGDLTLIDCPNELVVLEFERWMRGAGHPLVVRSSVVLDRSKPAVANARCSPRGLGCGSEFPGVRVWKDCCCWRWEWACSRF